MIAAAEEEAGVLTVRIEGGRMTAAIADSRGRAIDYEVAPAARPPALWAADVRRAGAARAYRVALWPGGGWSCDCPHSKYRGAYCKHKAAALEIAAATGVEMAKAQIEEKAKAEREAGVPAVYRAIVQVMAALSHDGVAKGRRNTQQGYDFRGIDDIYNALSPLLAEAKLCVLPRMLKRTQTERQAKSGGVLFSVVVEMEYDFVSAEDGSKHTVAMSGEAMDSADKATNKAASAAFKYACMQAFSIPTEGHDDADATTHEVAASAPPPAAQAPQQPQPKQAKSLWGHAQDRDAAFATEGLCRPGELTEYLREQLGPKLGANPHQWAGDMAAAQIRAAVVCFRQLAEEHAAADGAA